ncbi:MAG: hypothetical protein HYZ29_07030 [Myxococcales bacterium]|nr:hypothetical protein [Myxococcales bacterium]
MTAERFRLGLNYWPAGSAMGFWSRFDPGEVAADFARISAGGFDSLRLFLTWEDFQPAPDRVEAPMLERLALVLDLAHDADLLVMPTLFTGHMSGVNWLPGWALGGAERDERFRVVSGGKPSSLGLRNWYTDERVLRAQTLLAAEAAGAVSGHAALWAWDLGNESSNCVIPPTSAHAREWLSRITAVIRQADARALVTVGLHMEDLENERHLGPEEAAEVCDFLTMHGYPGYARWSRGATDELLLPFLAQVTRWLGGGKDVVFSEFGLPTYQPGDAAGESARSLATTSLVDEHEAASYTERALTALVDCGCTGAMLWCHADYVPALWDRPPFDQAVHERSFGLWRADASPKPAVATVREFARRHAASNPRRPSAAAALAWLDVDPQEFHRAPSTHLPRLYQRFCAALAG